MANKMTKREGFTRLLGIPAVQADTELVDMINHEISLLDARKSAERKPSKAQLEKAEAKKSFAQTVVNEMTVGQRYTISEMIASLPSCVGSSVSGLTSVMGILTATGEVIRTEEKRKAYFTRQ